MHVYGFSTGALALGDFNRALEMLKGRDLKAVELSALRDHELPALADSADSLQLDQFSYVSVHAPSRFSNLSEAEASRYLSVFVRKGWPVVMHPDAIRDPSHWKGFGSLLSIENMDKRKPAGRTPAELALWFDEYPEASFCLDLAHARQVDPSMAMAHDLITRFGDRLRQIHLSELDSKSKHRPLSRSTVLALEGVAARLPRVAVIIESMVDEPELDLEVEMARIALEG